MTTDESAQEPAAPEPNLTCGSRVVKRSIALPRSSVAAGGPVPALVASRRRWGLPLWLFLIATADPLTHRVDLRQFVGFARAFGLTGAAPTLRRNINRSLHTLVDHRLVRVVSTAYRHYTIELCDLEGHGDTYHQPSGDTKVIRIPGQLFSNGWHTTLTLTQLAGLLISLCEESWQYDPDRPGVWEKRRWHICRDYGIAESTWSEAKQGLLYWGLLEWGWSAPVREYQNVERVPSNRYTVDTTPLLSKPAQVTTYVAVAGPAVTVIAADTGKALRVPRMRRVKVPAPTAGTRVVPLTPPTTTSSGGAA